MEYDAPEGALLAIEQMAAMGGKGGYKVGRPNNAPQAISLNGACCVCVCTCVCLFVCSSVRVFECLCVCACV